MSENPYTEYSPQELESQLIEVEASIADLQAQRAEINKEELHAAEHRMLIVEAMGCLVLRRIEE